MKGLIIKKQYLDLIFDNGKVWEMRSTRTKVRGRIGLIESGSGLVVGEAYLQDCGDPLNESNALETTQFHHVTDLKLLKKWRFPWILSNAKRYIKPIPYKHPKGAVIWVNLSGYKETYFGIKI